MLCQMGHHNIYFFVNKYIIISIVADLNFPIISQLLDSLETNNCGSRIYLEFPTSSLNDQVCSYCVCSPNLFISLLFAECVCLWPSIALKTLCLDSIICFIKAMDQGRPLEGTRAHYDFLLITVKWILSSKVVLIKGLWVKVSRCRVVKVKR